MSSIGPTDLCGWYSDTREIFGGYFLATGFESESLLCNLNCPCNNLNFYSDSKCLVMFPAFRIPHMMRNVVRIQQTVVRHNSQKSEKTLNIVTLLGRVGADPQKRGSEEHPVINFPLATHYSYKYESGDMLQRTDWHRISIFKPGLRDTVYKYLKKGQRVYITGKLSYGEVKMDDGQVRSASTIIADDVIFFQNAPPEHS